MSGSAEAASPPAVRRDQSIAARRKRAEREIRIVGLLNGGHSISEIAAREGLTKRRMRAVVQEILGRRLPEPPSEFRALQVSRLNEALFVSHNAMSGANLQAVDRVVTIVRELDRYHGFPARASSAPPGKRRFEESSQAPLALDAPATGPAGNVAATY